MKRILIIFLIVLMGCIDQRIDEENAEISVQQDKQEDVAEESTDYGAYIEFWQDNHQINEDYVGQLFFDSGLINQPVVQGRTNEDYLRTDWKTMEYFSEGTVFMDYRNTIDDFNVILYGHYVYEIKDPTKTHMFTPLHVLKEKENYQQNRYFNFLLEEKLRRYEIVAVYYCQLYTENGTVYTNPQTKYYLTGYDSEYMDQYKEAINEQSFYEIDADFDENDKLLTLQTCVENRDDLRLIVIAKLIEETDIN